MAAVRPGVGAEPVGVAKVKDVIADDEHSDGGAPATDASLIEAIVQLDEDAYAEIVRRHYRSVLMASMMILRNGPEGEDVVTEVFVALWMKPGDFDPSRGSLLAFLRMKARGRSIDVLRSKMRRIEREQFVELEQHGRYPAEVDSAMLASESTESVEKAIAALPPLEQESVRMAFFGGMTYSAVALHLGVPEGTIKSRIRAGLRRLAGNVEMVTLHSTRQVPYSDNGLFREPSGGAGA